MGRAKRKSAGGGKDEPKVAPRTQGAAAQAPQPLCPVVVWGPEQARRLNVANTPLCSLADAIDPLCEHDLVPDLDVATLHALAACQANPRARQRVPSIDELVALQLATSPPVSHALATALAQQGDEGWRDFAPLLRLVCAGLARLGDGKRRSGWCLARPVAGCGLKTGDRVAFPGVVACEERVHALETGLHAVAGTDSGAVLVVVETRCGVRARRVCGAKGSGLLLPCDASFVVRSRAVLPGNVVVVHVQDAAMEGEDDNDEEDEEDDEDTVVPGGNVQPRTFVEPLWLAVGMLVVVVACVLGMGLAVGWFDLPSSSMPAAHHAPRDRRTGEENWQAQREVTMQRHHAHGGPAHGGHAHGQHPPIAKGRRGARSRGPDSARRGS